MWCERCYVNAAVLGLAQNPLLSPPGSAPQTKDLSYSVAPSHTCAHTHFLPPPAPRSDLLP